MEEQELIGILTKRVNKFIVITEEGKEYRIYAINPWQAVSIDYDTGKYNDLIGKKVRVFGRFLGTEIWKATIEEIVDDTQKKNEIKNNATKKKKKSRRL